MIRAGQALRDRTVAARPGPDFVIGEPDAPYMHRWYVIPRNKFFNVYLHHVLRSDDDRALHSHPWLANLSLIIDNSYVEHTIAAGGVNYRKTYNAGAIKIRGNSAHRLELNNGPCWTLFFTGPKIRIWHFHCKKGLVPYYDFVKPTDVGQVGRGCGEME